MIWTLAELLECLAVEYDRALMRDLHRYELGRDERDHARYDALDAIDPLCGSLR